MKSYYPTIPAIMLILMALLCGWNWLNFDSIYMYPVIIYMILSICIFMRSQIARYLALITLTFHGLASIALLAIVLNLEVPAQELQEISESTNDFVFYSKVQTVQVLAREIFTLFGVILSFYTLTNKHVLAVFRKSA